MELRRIYDEDFNYLGYLKDRKEPLDPEEYYVVAGVMVISEKKLLVTKRAKGKDFAHQWEFTMGSVVDKESPLQGALRELKEEVGIRATDRDLSFLGTMKENQKFSKIFLLVRDVDKIKMQRSEVEDYKFVGKKELKAMLADGEFAPPMAKRIENYFEKIEGLMED